MRVIITTARSLGLSVYLETTLLVMMVPNVITDPTARITTGSAKLVLETDLGTHSCDALSL